MLFTKLHIANMRIGFDAKRVFNNSTGLGNYCRQLIMGLSARKQHQYFLYTPKISLVQPELNLPNIQLIKPRWQIFGALKRLIGFSLNTQKIDVFHGLTNELPLMLPQGVKKVVTIHDLIFLRYPNYYASIDRFIYKLKVKKAVKSADVVVAISNSTKRDIERFFNVSNEKIKVIPLSYNPIFEQKITHDTKALMIKKYSLFTPFFICVGTIEPRKLQQQIAKAFILSGLHHCQLLFVGNASSNYAQELKSIIKNHSNIRILKVDRINDLQVLYQQATGLIYLSEYEGFGMPLLEAMVSGCPVITCRESSLPEVCGDAAYYVNHDDINEIADAFARIKSEEKLRETLINLGYQQSKHFLPELMTGNYLQLYHSILKA